MQIFCHPGHACSGRPLFFIGRFAKYLEKRGGVLCHLKELRRIHCNRLLSWQGICINDSVKDDDFPFKLKPEHRSMRVLIVEDDFVGSRLMKKFLEADCFCHLAFDGREAIEAFEAALKEEKPYDLLFLDIMMPEVNGVEVLKTVRKMEEDKGIPPEEGVKVIMTTAMNDADVIMESFSARCDGYMVKPIRKDKLFEEIENLGLLTRGK
jgi:two-component system chemotaxis response regulator CheY